MLGEQLDSGPVSLHIGLGKILDSIYQQSLAVHVTGITRTLPRLALGIRTHWNSEYLGHSSYDVPRASFVAILVTLTKPRVEYSAPNPVGQLISYVPASGLRFNDFSFAGGLQFEDIVRNTLVNLDIRVLRQTVIAQRSEKLLLHGYPTIHINP